jgi:hypothetical protein
VLKDLLLNIDCRKGGKAPLQNQHDQLESGIVFTVSTLVTVEVADSFGSTVPLDLA